MLPVMTVGERDPVPGGAVGPVAGAAAAEHDGTSATDLVMPFVALGVAGALAGYGYLRRTRRARTRTTPGVVSSAPPVPTSLESERQARAALVLADDCVRGSEEELSFVVELFDEETIEPFTHALLAARTELSAAFAIWRRYEEGIPGDQDARRQALVGVIGRCAEAGRRLDAEAPALDRLRGLEEEGAGAALQVAEGRFRELTARTAEAQDTAAELHRRYAPSATAPVTGYVEQAKDRLVFATSRLNEARQAADAQDGARTARHLRAAEGAVAQAGVLIRGVERLSAQLREASVLVPAALTGGEAEIAEARKARSASLTAGESHARLAHADGVLAAVRTELTGGPYDPLDSLRRIARAVERLEVRRSGVVRAAALLVARGTVGEAEDFVGVHRGAVGAQARARLAEAIRALGSDAADEADRAARQARELAERDVLAHGTPYAQDGPTVGLAGAVLGGILLAEDPDAGPPTSYGGPSTRARRHLP